MPINYASKTIEMLDERFLRDSRVYTKYNRRKAELPPIEYTDMTSFYILTYGLLISLLALPFCIVLAFML